MSVLNIAIIDEDGDIVVFIQPNMLLAGTDRVDEQNQADVYQKTAIFVRGTLEVIQTTCERSLNAQISFALCEDICRWQHIASIYSSLKEKLDHKTKRVSDMIISVKNMSVSGHAADADNIDKPPL